MKKEMCSICGELCPKGNILKGKDGKNICLFCIVKAHSDAIKVLIERTDMLRKDMLDTLKTALDQNAEMAKELIDLMIKRQK